MSATVTAPESISPSLRSAARMDAAYELKFVVAEPVAAAIQDWSAQHLAPDPHGDPGLAGAYRTVSLYFDTPEFDVYHRTRGYWRRKYRVRRYGAGGVVFLERKTRDGNRVSKRRSQLPLAELAQLQEAAVTTEWSGAWFQRRLARRRLQPACVVGYERSAYFGACSEGPLRLTLDRELHGAPARDWTTLAARPALPLLLDGVVLELKFATSLPQPFKELVARFGLATAAVSKYRLCREAWGLPAGSA